MSNWARYDIQSGEPEDVPQAALDITPDPNGKWMKVEDVRLLMREAYERGIDYGIGCDNYPTDEQVDGSFAGWLEATEEGL